MEEPVGIGRDPVHPLPQGASVHGVIPPFTSPVDDFFVRKHGPEFRTPVHGLFREVGKSSMLDLGSLLIMIEVGPGPGVLGGRCRDAPLVCTGLKVFLVILGGPYNQGSYNY